MYELLLDVRLVAGEWQTQLSRQQIKALRRQKKEEESEGGREATNLTSPEATQEETEAKSEGELMFPW